MATQTRILGIDGMHCGGCASKIRASLLQTTGVTDASVSPQDATAMVRYDGPVEDDALRQAVTRAGGYRVTTIEKPTDSVAPAAVRAPAADAKHAMDTAEKTESLYPLFLIVGFITGVTLLIAAATDVWAVEPMMRHFMAGFFIVFSFFKLLDPPGFVSAYRGYDLIARKLPVWGWAYPFVELTLGVAYLLAWLPIITSLVTLILMLVGAAGVLKALLDKRAIRCACLGTALNLPMTKVTLVEDLTMAAMAALMLLLMAL
jgi:copper chaperone CopZ